MVHGEKESVMLIVSSREFRERQKSYLDLVDQGVEVFIQRGKNKSYRITALRADDAVMSQAEFQEKLDRAYECIQAGKGRTVRTEQELRDYLAKL